MSKIYKDAPIVKIVMLKGADGDKSKLSELQNDMTFLTEEQIINLVTNIVDSGSVGDIDTGFVTRLKEQNRGKELKFWVGTQAEYDAIEIAQANTFYIITDDNFKEVTNQAIQALNDRLDAIKRTNYDEEISDLQTRVGLLTTDVGTLENTAATHTEQIADVTNKVDDSRYVSGDTDTIDFMVGGALTPSRRMRFAIPLKKFVGAGLTVVLNSIDMRVYRGTAQYVAQRTYTASDFDVVDVNGAYMNVVCFTPSTFSSTDSGAIGLYGTANISVE